MMSAMIVLIGFILTNHNHVMALSMLRESDRHQTKQAWQSNCREGRESDHFQSKIYIFVHAGQKNCCLYDFNCYK